MNLLGVKTNCQMMQVINGAFVGFLSGFLLMAQIYFAPGSPDLVLPALGLSLFSLILTCAFFGIFFRFNFGQLFSSLFLGAMLSGVITIYLAMLINNDIAQPFVMFLIGSILGSFIARLLCRQCEKEG